MPQQSLSIVMYLLGISSYKVAKTKDLASVNEANLDTIKQINPQLVINH
jgi:ABC-type enterochelin transport system substrate-binding protein